MDGNLVGRLVLALLPNEQLNGQPLFGKPLFEPAPRQMHHRVLPGQALAEFRHKGTGQGQFGLSHVRHDHDEVRRMLLRHVLQAVSPLVGEVAIVPGHHQAGRDPAQILDQRQPQHDRHRPQLAQFQRGHRLVSRDEGAQRFGINLRIHVRNQLEHQFIDPRKSRRRTVHEPGQLPAIAPGQMPPGHLNLFLDQVKVVE